MRSPTMSMNAVTIRTTSLAMKNAIRSLRHLPQRRRRHRAPDHASERDDRKDVGDHLHELRRDDLRALEADLERLGRGEEQAGEADAQRVPAAEDRGREGDEAATGGHAVGELMLVQCEVRAS